jgi:serine/threonine-protein kinase
MPAPDPGPRRPPQQGPGGDAPDLATAAPTGPGSDGSSILARLAETTRPLPRVLLCDTESDTWSGPVVTPLSPGMPALAGPAARLQLLGEIGRGGMGAVLKGRDGDLGRDLAVKVLLETHRDRPDMVHRFVEEAQIAGQLQHPGVVPVYELGCFADRRPFFTMKLVRGRTLADLLADRPDPASDLPRFLSVFLQVCQTVAYAHARGVIHRDLKPSNVMVGAFGEVQVMDWGLAKVLPRAGGADDAAAGRDPAEEAVVATARSGGDSDIELSRDGSVMGTPPYMAPEQARGEAEAVDERADVFALGSVLCEGLTGLPAFVGRTPGEIQRRSARGDLADAFARLAACGADAGLIELARACLAAERDDRPRDAGAVAARLSAYLAGVQERLRAAELARAAESARAEEAEARAQAERRARRMTMALAASVLGMTTLSGLAFTLVARQRQARAEAGERLVVRATTLLDQARARPDDPGRWRTALEATRPAEDDPGGLDPAARARLVRIKDDAAAGLRAAEGEATLRQALVEVRAGRLDAGAQATDAAYAAAFRAAGLDVDALDPAEAGARLRRRPAAVAVELAAFLDHWSGVRREARRLATSWRPLAVARAADPDPYRDRLRALLATDDLRAQAAPLRALAEESKAAELPAPTAVLLAGILEDLGDREAAVGLLRRAAAQHPDDVWVNFTLAYIVDRQGPSLREEAVRYYTAARAVHPGTAHDLAHLLERLGRGEEAEAVFRDLVARRPGPRNLTCFGVCLKGRGRADEASRALSRAVVTARAALRSSPDDTETRFHLANALRYQGQLDEAIAEYRAALALDPGSAEAHNNLGSTFFDQGKAADAATEFRAALGLKPDNANTHHNLGVALEEQGRVEEAIAEYRAALRLKPDLAVAHHRLGDVLGAQGKLAEAEAEIRAALGLMPKAPGPHYSLGLALGVQGRVEEAIAEYRAAVRLWPDFAEAHCNLGLALRLSGRYAEALEELRRGHELGSKRPGWRHPSAQWVRESERMGALDARLPGVLKGDDRPADTAERLAFGQLCSERKLPVASARFYAEALRADPKLADDRRAQHAYNAACAAALAGCGRGKDDPPPDDAARAQLRGQALAWLRGELSAWSRLVDGGPPGARAAIRRVLEHWRADPDLAGVRDGAELAKLPDEEHRAWLALWEDVGTLLEKARGDHP